MKEPILHKARIKPILDKNNSIVVDSGDYTKINELIREKTISEIDALYVPKEIYTLSIDLIDIPEYEFSFRDSYINYDKLISWLQKKLSTDQNIILIASMKGWYSYLGHHIEKTTITDTPVFEANVFGRYSKIYVCVGEESIEPWLTDEQLKLLNSRKEHLKALKIFETMYLPGIKDAIKKISPDNTVLYQPGIYDRYAVSFPREVIQNIIRSYINNYIGDISKDGIETKIYYSYASDIEVSFDIKKFKENIINNEKVEA